MTLHATDAKIIETKWDKIRAEVSERWPTLSDSDLEMIDGDSRKLVALVHQRTGANLSEIESQIDELARSSEGLMSRISGTISQATSQMTDRISESATQAQQSVGETIHRHPGKSVALVFGVGVALGLILTAPRSRKSACQSNSWLPAWSRKR